MAKPTSSRSEAENIIERTLAENPTYWPFGFDINNFDGGLYLAREKKSHTAIGLVGWQERNEFAGNEPIKVGYYTIAILPEHRRHGYAKEAVARIITLKSARVDKVRAMVMAHNQPSLGLAGKLGVETLVKKAMMNRLMSAFRSPIEEGILGPAARAAARGGGVNLLLPEKFAPKGDPHALSSMALNWLRDRKILPGISPTARQIPEGTGVAFSPLLNKLAPTAHDRAQLALGVRTPSFGSDKLYEAKAFKGYIPRSRSLEDFTGEGAGRLRLNRPNDLGQLQQRLSATFPRGWVVKNRLGMASAPGDLISDQAPNLSQLSPGEHYMAQARMPLAKLPAWQQQADNLINRSTGGAFANTNRGTQEMRVHALNGKVIPYASLSRGSTLGGLAPLLPMRTSAMRRAEAHVQEALDRISPNHTRNTMYGFDVGFNPEGRPFLIEANPSDAEGGTSGMLKNPFVQDALGSAIAGRVPAYVKARRGLYGAGALGAGSLAMQQPSQ